MKQIFFFLTILLASAGCKKNTEKPTEIFLSEIKSKGVVTTSFEYSSDKKLIRVNGHDAGALSYRFVFKYDVSGKVSELTSYTFPGEIPVTKSITECDNQGKILHVTTYELQGNSPNTPVSTATFIYNTAGLLSKVERRDNDDKFLYSSNFTYYPNGNLEEMQFFRPNGLLLWLSDKSSYSVSNGSLPKGIDQVNNLMGPDYLAPFFSESSSRYTYNQGGALLTQTSRLMSSREFNDDGSLSKELQITTFQKPIKPKEESPLEFEYIVK